MTPEERKAYQREWREANRDELLAHKREYYAANKEKVLARNRAYRAANLEEDLSRQRAYYAANRKERLAYQSVSGRIYREVNREKVLASKRAYYEDNHEKYRASGAKRRAKKLGATPEWLTERQLSCIQDLYEAARMLSERSVLYEYAVDHIVPLQSRRVCGLHVPCNLQILTAEENGSKHNKLPPADQLVDYSAKGYAGVRAKLKRRAQ